MALAVPVAEFTVSTNSVCIGQTVVFTDASSGTITSYLWNFGTGASPATSSLQGPVSVTYSTSGYKTISLTVNGPDGTNTITKTDFVFIASAIPSITGIINGPESVCTNASGINYSLSPVSTATNYTWTGPSGSSVSSGQGSTSVSIDFGSLAGDVCVTAANGCGNSQQVCKTVSVGKDQIKLMSYNLLNYPDVSDLTIDTTERNPYLRTIVQHINPDIMVVQEITSQTGVNGILTNVLNATLGGFSAATFVNGFDTDNALFYRSSKFSFAGLRVIPTDLRDIDEYSLVHLLSGDTIRIYSVHLKASATSADEAQRAQEVDSLRKYTNLLPAGSNFLVVGDFNIYRSGESAYQKLKQVTNGADGHFIDPLNLTGTWNNSTYAPYHTQSTRTRAIGDGGSTGGLNDRFDMILYSSAVSQPGGVSYVSGSLTPVGNDGNHYNDSINQQPNTAVSTAIADALYYMADHLPITALIDFENSSCPLADLGMTQLMDPLAVTCSNPAQPLQVRIKNYGTSTVNFGLNNLQVNLQVTTPALQQLNFSTTINNGTLSPGAETTVNFLSTLNMSLTGAYSFQGWTSFAGDTVVSNDSMTAKSVEVYPNSSASISASGSTTFCTGGSVLLHANPSDSVTWQWQRDGNEIPGATANNYPASLTGNYRVMIQKTNTIETSIPSASFSNNNSYNIPNNSCTGASSIISVSGYSNTVPSAGISIKININHTAVGDLVLYLEGPNGQRLGLSNRTGNTGNTGNDFINTVFSDNGTSSIPTTGAPYTGTYKPWPATYSSCVSSTITTFSAFGGGSIDPNGNWKLLAFDRASGNSGTIAGWQITFPSYTIGTSLVCQPVYSSPLSVTVNPLPQISISPSLPVVCSGSGVTLTASGATTYNWQPSSGLSSTSGNTVFANPPSATSYTITGTDGNGCTGSATTSVSVNSPPTVTLGNFAPVCQSSGTFTLTGGSPAGGVYSGTGVNSGIFNPALAGPGTHLITYTYTDINGCSGTASSTIQVNPSPNTTTVPSGSVNVCSGGTVTINASPGYNYLWSNGETTSGIQVSAAGSYTVLLTDPAGCSATSSPVAVTISAFQMMGTVFSESLGSVAATTSIATHELNNGFDNDLLTMSGTGDIRSTTVSTGYLSASAGANVFLTNTLSTGRIFTISGINTSGLSNLQLNFGVFKSTTASNGSELTVQVSTDGVNYSNLTFSPLPTGSGTAIWHYRTISTGIPTANNLYVQFASSSANNTGPQFRIDDISITYNISSPSISASGSTNLCQGNSVTLTATPSVSYLWDNGSTTQSIIVNSTGNRFCTVSGSNGCLATTNSIPVTVNPELFSVSGGGTFCQGGLGPDVGLTGSTAGVTYYLQRNGVNTGAVMTGTGAPLSFGNQFTGGIYSILAVDASNSCNGLMNGSATVSVNLTPVIHSMTGGGNYCSGGSGVTIGLNGSETGISYQLYLTGLGASGSPINGTGSALSFGNRQQNGTYYVIATNSSTGCTATMNGSASVTVNPAPALFTITGGGNYCPGTSGVEIGLTGSTTSVQYNLQRDGIYSGFTLVGTGSALSFGFQTTTGNYTVIATITSTGCTTTMTGTTNVSQLAPPLLFNVTGGGSYCESNGSGAPIGLNNSETGVSYQLFLNNIATSDPAITGNGSVLTFSNQTNTGVYTVLATRINSGCTATMNGAASVTRIPSFRWFADNDNDGYGNPSLLQIDCSQPAGYISDSTDCDDGNTTIYPGAIEICGNGIDEDCNGLTDDNCPVSLHLQLFLEGFYRTSATMLPVASPLSNPNLCDTVIIRLANSTSPYNILRSDTATIGTNGIVSFTYPSSIAGSSYYIVVNHRNSLETWSSAPVLVNTSTLHYDFIHSASSAYGNMLINMGDGHFAIPSGDVNQDGAIDATDYTLMETALDDFLAGYVPWDLNGDGVTEAADFSLLENNAFPGIMLSKP